MNNLFTVLILFTALSAAGESRMGSDKSADTFKADGKQVSAQQAVELAKNHKIERCRTPKNVTGLNGEKIAAYKCDLVILEYNYKTGIPHWVRP